MEFKCRECGVIKSISDFQKNKSKIGHDKRCKTCFRIYYRKYHEQNKEKIKQTKKDRLLTIKIYVCEYLTQNHCVDCGESDIVCLDFDHIKDKKATINHMLSKEYSLDNIIDEIAKCQVRCGNCHKRKTAKQLNYYKDIIK